jgi:hypothetical protein
MDDRFLTTPSMVTSYKHNSLVNISKNLTRMKADRQVVEHSITVGSIKKILHSTNLDGEQHVMLLQTLFFPTYFKVNFPGG